MRISRFEFNDLHDFRPHSEAFVLNEIVEEMKQEVIAVPEKPTFSKEQIEAAKDAAQKSGYADGFEAGLQQAKHENAQRERDMQGMLERIEMQLKSQQETYEALLSNESREVGQLVMAIARKIAGDALTQKPEIAVQELLSQCLPILMQKPRIVIETHPQMTETITKRITPFLARAGFEGDVQYRANDTLEPHDAVIEWAGGKAVRNNESMWQEIQQMINQLSFAATPTPREQQ